MERCPIRLFKDKMIKRGQLDDARYESLKRAVDAEIAEAAERAARDADDSISLDEAFSYVYAPGKGNARLVSEAVRARLA